MAGGVELEKGGADSLGGDRSVDGGGSSGDVDLLPLGTLAMIEVMRTELDNVVIVKVVGELAGGGTGRDGLGALGTPVGGTADTLGGDRDEMVGVISGVLVTNVLKRLGGAILFSHSVVPLTTEK